MCSIHDAIVKNAHDRVMEILDTYKVPVAIFWMDGKVKSIKITSKDYSTKTRIFIDDMIGVYDDGVDSRQLMIDISQMID